MSSEMYRLAISPVVLKDSRVVTPYDTRKFAASEIRCGGGASILAFEAATARISELSWIRKLARAEASEGGDGA